MRREGKSSRDLGNPGKSPHAVEDRQGDQQDEEQDDDEKHDVARLVREVVVMIVMMVEVPAFWLGF
jgi:hypothetical protein